MELSTRVFNCCFQGDLAELEALLQQNSGDRELNVDLFTLENGQNALHSACMGTMNDPCGDKEGSKKIGKKLVKLLLDHGADINAQTARGHTPLMLAIRHNAQECMQQLLASRANVHLHDLADKDALFFALQYNSKPRLSASSSGDPGTCM
jgi:ankyrin repeat protein